MEKAAKAAGYTLKAMDGKGDAALQNTQIDEFITQKCDAIFLNPADSKATVSGVRAAMLRASRSSPLTSRWKTLRSRNW